MSYASDLVNLLIKFYFDNINLFAIFWNDEIRLYNIPVSIPKCGNFLQVKTHPRITEF